MRVAWWHLAVLPQELGSCNLLTLSAIFPPKLASKINQPCQLGCSPQIFFTSNLDVRCKHSGASVWGSAQTRGHILPRHWQLFLRQNSIALFGLLLERDSTWESSADCHHWIWRLVWPCVQVSTRDRGCLLCHSFLRIVFLHVPSLLRLFVYGRCYVFITILFFFSVTPSKTLKFFMQFGQTFPNSLAQEPAGCCPGLHQHDQLCHV